MEIHTYFDLKGYINLQVVGAKAKDIEMIRNQLGIKDGKSSGKEVNITLRFVENLTPKIMNYIGGNKFGYSDGNFFILNPSTGEAQVQIPLDQIGGEIEIVCKRGITRIPLLKEILKLYFLKLNIFSLHASAIEYDQKGIVVLGWAQGGKTSALLAYIQQGARFVADDWVLYDSENDRVFGLPGRLSISDHHIQQMPVLKSKLEKSTRLRLWGLKQLINFLSLVAKVFRWGIAHKAINMLQGLLQVSLHPKDIFLPKSIIEYVSPRKMVFMTSHSEIAFEAQEITQNELVDFIIPANDFEYNHLRETYLAFLFAFPGRRNLLIERRQYIEISLLKRALIGKETFRIYHPYPFQISAFIKNIL